MRIRTQSVSIIEPLNRAIRLVASIALIALLVLVSPTVAQDGGNQAGLVIQFGDGSLHTTCVDLGSSGQATGEEVLRASGVATLIDYGSGFGGGTVCKIEDEGCNFPAEKCFCQCTMKPGDPCVYWSYFHLIDGQWRYSPQGATRYVVRPGDVEAWAWGLGSSATGVAPPVYTFEQLCGVQSEAAASPAALQPPLPTDTPTLLEPVAKTMTPSPVTPVTVTAKPTPSTTQTSTQALVMSDPEAELITPTEGKMAVTTLPVQNEAGGADNSVSYIVFGVLAVVLVGGLIFLRVR